MRTPSSRRGMTGLAALVLLLVSAAPATAVSGPAAEDGSVADSWIVTLVAGADVEREAPGLARAAGGRIGHVYAHALTGFQFKGSAAAAAALERNPLVRTVVADRPLQLEELLPNGVKRIDAYQTGGAVGAFQEGYRGNGVRIGILDTGIDLTHPDLAASLDPGLGINCVGSGPPIDGHGHGTHVAGTAAAPRNNVGVVGVAPEARLVAAKVFTDSGTSSTAIVLCGIDHFTGLALDGDPSNDIAVANMSWGETNTSGDCADGGLREAICTSVAAGITYVAAAGNSAANASTFVPAAYPEVITVSAYTDLDGLPGGLAGCKIILELLAFECDDTMAFFSNYGPIVDVTAPGVGVHSTTRNGGYATNSGTSMAAPHVTGVAALVRAANPTLSPAEVKAVLRSTGECPNGEAADADGVAGCEGQGRWPDDRDSTPEPLVNALRAARAAADVGPPPPPDPEPTPPSAPTLVTATAADASVEVGWSAPADDGGSRVTGYVIYRDTQPGAAAAVATVGDVTSWTDTGLVNGTTYHYRVAATNAAGTGPPSNELSATPQAAEPPAPPPPNPALPGVPLDLAVGKSPPNGVLVSWSPPADDGGAPIDVYRVYRGTSAGSLTLLATVDGGQTSYRDATVAKKVSYWYAVAAVNMVGEGARTITVSYLVR